MKLIIDINDNEYEGIKGYPDNTSYPVTIHLYDAVRNGTPLDDIKAEINQIYDDMGYKRIYKEDVFKILDRHTGKEVSE